MEAVTVLPVLAASLIIIVIVIKLYQKIRTKLPKRVNCWFCNKNTTVPFKYKDSWKCPTCEQYNGFTPEGNYNRVLHAQYNVSLNKPVYRLKKLLPGKNELCRFCNINQELKVAQLSKFVPIEPTNFDEEVDMYRQQLEKAYRLCNKCEIVLSEKLTKQKSWLQNMYKDIGSFIDKSSNTVNQVKSRRFYYAYFTAFISAGLFLSAASCFQLSKEMMNYAISRLQLITAHYPLLELILPQFVTDKLVLLRPWIGFDDVPLMLTGFGAVVQLLKAFEQQDVPAVLGVVTWLILSALSLLSADNLILIAIVEMLAGGVTFIANVVHIKELQLAKLRAKQPVNNKFNITASPDVSIYNGPPVSETKSERPTSPSVPSPKHSNSLKTNPNPPAYPKTPNTSPSAESPIQNSFKKSLVADDFGLSKLNLGASKSQHKRPRTFETRSYGSKVSNELFRPVLSPAKLSVESLYSGVRTRSSSQSSGFGSSASQHYDAMPLSIVGDFDLASIDNCSIAPYPRTVCNSLYQHPMDSMFLTPPYYHFAAQYHRMYQPVPTQAMFNSSYNATNSNTTLQFMKNTFYSLPLTLLILSNLALVWLVVYKEFVVR